MKNNLCSSLWSGYDQARMRLWRHERRFFFEKVMWSVVCSDQGSRLKAGLMNTTLTFGYISKSRWAVTRRWNRKKMGVVCFQIIIDWLFISCTVFLHFEMHFKRSVQHLVEAALSFTKCIWVIYICFFRLGWHPTFICFGGDFWGRSRADHCRTASSPSVFHAPRLCWPLRNPGKTCPPRYVWFCLCGLPISGALGIL